MFTATSRQSLSGNDPAIDAPYNSCVDCRAARRTATVKIGRACAIKWSLRERLIDERINVMLSFLSMTINRTDYRLSSGVTYAYGADGTSLSIWMLR